MNFGTEITIPDKQGDGTNGWRGDQEDNEVEPPSVVNANRDRWDLEKMFYDGTSLTMIGTWDFYAGFGDYESGDIFIDTTGDAVYGDKIGPFSTNQYGYDYALDVNWATKKIDIVSLDSTTPVENAFFVQNRASNPYRLAANQSGGNIDIKYGSFAEDSADNIFGLGSYSGGSTLHNYVTFDISSITNFKLAHFTLGCGNDNLIGAVPTPEPASMLLTGLGLLGMAAFQRRRSVKKA